MSASGYIWTISGALLCLLGHDVAEAAPPNVGDLSPDFTLENVDGGQVSLSDFRGRVVLMNFFGYN